MLAEEYAPEVKLAGDLESAVAETALNIRSYSFTIDPAYLTKAKKALAEVNQHAQAAKEFSEQHPRLVVLKEHLSSLLPDLQEWEKLILKTEENGNELVRLRTAGRLDQLGIPGIYLFGKQDQLYPLAGGHLQEDALPNVQFFYPNGTGHQGQTDQPELFNQVLLEFFRDGKVSGPTASRAGVSDRRPVNPNLVAAY